MTSSRLPPVIETVISRARPLRRLADDAFRISIIVVTVGSFVLSIVRILRDPDHFQWDLEVYYNSPLLLARGQNPYEDGGIVSGFVYSPIHLEIFRVFSSAFTYTQFYWVFLITKIASFAILLAIWKKFFLKETQLHVFAIFVWLGFYSAVFKDFQAGNISIFESTVLFLAFICFLKQRPYSFVFLVVLAASFKITPIFFLILLLLAPNKYSLRCFALGCVGFLAFALLNLILFTDLTKQFISQALKRTTDEPGQYNPSSLSFITDALTTSLNHLGLVPSSMVANVIYLAVGILILWISWRSWKIVKVTNEESNYNLSFLILFSVLVYTLTLPRMKDYAYIVAIPSVLFAIEHFEISVPRWVLFLPLVLISHYSQPPLFRFFWDYYPLFVASFFWYLYLSELKKPSALASPTKTPQVRTYRASTHLLNLDALSSLICRLHQFRKPNRRHHAKDI
jgi:hypothetical protein